MLMTIRTLGDAYTFVAIEWHSKLMLNFALGKRDQRNPTSTSSCSRVNS